MGFVKGSFFIGFLFILNCGSCIFANEEIKTYVVHIGARQHDDPDLVAESHQRMLEPVFESAEAARESIIYHYQHGFSGFAARLTESQAKKLSERPDVFQVALNQRYQLHNTRVPEYLGILPELPGGILQESDMGSELVIGFVDDGVWPESEAYSDKGLGPIPKHWKGGCVAGQNFDPAKHCNKKLVGAKYFFDGFYEQSGRPKLSESDFMSPRGVGGHGTLVSSVAASAFVANASVRGLAPGVLRGIAPKARIAMYKVVWSEEPWKLDCINVLKAVDEAIKDNIDVLSVSVGPEPPYRLFNAASGIDVELGSFHAVLKGIPVIASGGNSGPDAYTISNIAPWILTVGASTLDRTYLVDMTFGNNITIPGQAIYSREGVESADLIYVQDVEKLTDSVRGKVILTFATEDSMVVPSTVALSGNGAAGVIVARTTDFLCEDMFQLPAITVDYEVGSKILQYIRSSSSPTVKISTGRTFVGRPIPSTVAGFSCRGPNSVAPAILKPDIVAPGMLVLGAYGAGFGFAQGTSFAAPIVAGVVTLLKALHPEWSPAALKSAVMTSAWKTDPYGEPIFSEGNPRKLADPFDFGSGLVNAERARDPGLVYDMNIDDYIHYFCATGYNESAITLLTGKPTKCGTPLPSILDVNYPAITIPDLSKEVTLTRTVTNVGPVDSVYRAVIEPPKGIKIVVEPETLKFSSSTKILGFKVRVSPSRKSSSDYLFGSFTWTDGTRNVSIPLSVRTRFLKP